jgi:hypothetical protein
MQQSARRSYFMFTVTPAYQCLYRDCTAPNFFCCRGVLHPVASLDDSVVKEHAESKPLYPLAARCAKIMTGAQRAAIPAQ